MKYFLLLGLFLMTLSSQAQNQLVVDPSAEPRSIEGSFHSIKVSSGINLYLSKSDVEAIAVSAEDAETKARIKTEITNGELHIYYSSGEKLRYGKNSRMNVYVGYTGLGQINASGSSDIHIAGVLETAALNIHMTGASDFSGAVKVNDLNIKLSGASDMKLSGTAKNVNIESSGASDVKAYDLATENCNVKVSGASDVNITVTKEVYAIASGASDVYFKGGAELKQKETNGSSVIARVN